MQDPLPPPLIVHVVHRMDYGGMENGLINLINSLPVSRYRHAVVSLTSCSDFRLRLQRPDVPCISLEKRPGKDPKAYVRLWRLLHRLRPRIVHTRNTGTIDCAVIARLAGVAIRIHGHHGWDVGDLDGENPGQMRLRRVCDPFVTAYVAVSREIGQWLRTRLGIAASRISEIYNGVDLSRFSNRSAPGADQFASRETSPFVIGTVGRLEAVKDQMTLIRGFAEMVRRYPEEARRARLLIVGDGTLRATLQQGIDEAGLQNKAEITGWCDDVPLLLRKFDVMVLTSLKEGISNTVLEAMASELPVIATDVGGNPELIVDQETGYLTPAGSADQLAEALGTYLRDPALARQHGRTGRARVEAEFSLTRMVKSYDNLYSRLLSTEAQS